MQLININQLPAFGPDTFVAHLKGQEMRTLRSFYPRIAKAFLFSEYFGKNLDALFDCLCNFENLPLDYKHVVLVVHNAPEFLSKEKPEKREAVLQIMLDAAISDNRYDEYTFEVFWVKL